MTHQHNTMTHHRNSSIPQRMGCALAEVGPSITLAACCEVLAFGLGGLTGMPAIRNFSLCAAAAVALDYVLQVTAFVAVLALDQARLEAGRLDLLPWVQLPRHVLAAPPPEPPPSPAASTGRPVPISGADSQQTSPRSGVLSRSLHNGVAPSSAPRAISKSASNSWRGQGPLGPASGTPSFPGGVLRASTSSTSLAAGVGGSFRHGMLRVSSSQGSLAALGSTAAAAAAAATVQPGSRDQAGAPGNVAVVPQMPPESASWHSRPSMRKARLPDYEPEGWGVEPALQWYMEHLHLPLLLRTRTARAVIVFVFGTLFLASLAALPHVQRCVLVDYYLIIISYNNGKHTTCVPAGAWSSRWRSLETPICKHTTRTSATCFGLAPRSCLWWRACEWLATTATWTACAPLQGVTTTRCSTRCVTVNGQRSTVNLWMDNTIQLAVGTTATNVPSAGDVRRPAACRELPRHASGKLAGRLPGLDQPPAAGVLPPVAQRHALPHWRQRALPQHPSGLRRVRNLLFG